MSCRFCVRAAAALLALAAISSHAIVDTGPGPGSSDGWSLYNVAGDYQSLAASFEITESTTIRLAQGWIAGFASGDVVMSLHAGGSPAAPIAYSTVFNVPGGEVAGWFGATGLQWAVTPGSYTLSFEAQSGTSASMPDPSPNPLAIEWYRGAWTDGQWGQTFLGLGVRVSAIPEPGSHALLALGLLGVGAAAWRRR